MNAEIAEDTEGADDADDTEILDCRKKELGLWDLRNLLYPWKGMVGLCSLNFL